MQLTEAELESASKLVAELNNAIEAIENMSDVPLCFVDMKGTYLLGDCEDYTTTSETFSFHPNTEGLKAYKVRAHSKLSE